MNFYLARILRNKLKYFTIMVIIGIAYFAIPTFSSRLTQSYAEINPSYVFDIENVYELKSLINNNSLLGIEANTENEVKFDDELVQELKNTEGIHSVCLCGVFSPLSKIVGSMPLNDSIQNFMLYGLGEGFEEVLRLEVLKNGDAVSPNPEIYIESTLAQRLDKIGMKKKELEVGKEKSKYIVNGTFHALGVKDRQTGNLFTGIHKIKESGQILIRLTPGANMEKVENSIYHLLTNRYKIDRTAFDFSPLSLYGKENWFGYRNQIVSFFLVALISLFYVMLSLLGLYWNETKSRNVEIGLMRAVGFTRMQVFGLFIKEATFISAVAIVIAQIIIINIYPEELKEPKALFVTIAFNSMVVLGIVWLSVFIPAYLSTKIHPVEALAEE